jgi:hypothetical protein
MRYGRGIESGKCLVDRGDAGCVTAPARRATVKFREATHSFCVENLMDKSAR